MSLCERIINHGLDQLWNLKVAAKPPIQRSSQVPAFHQQDLHPLKAPFPSQNDILIKENTIWMIYSGSPHSNTDDVPSLRLVGLQTTAQDFTAEQSPTSAGFPNALVDNGTKAKVPILSSPNLVLHGTKMTAQEKCVGGSADNSDSKKAHKRRLQEGKMIALDPHRDGTAKRRTMNIVKATRPATTTNQRSIQRAYPSP